MFVTLGGLQAAVAPITEPMHGSVAGYQPGTAGSLTDEQAVHHAMDPRLETVAVWAQDPEQAGYIEATALLDALEEIKAEAAPLAKDLKKITSETAKKLAETKRLRAQLAELSRQGMGELDALERVTGEWEDPFMHGFIDKIRKKVSDVAKPITRPIQHGIMKVYKAVVPPQIRAEMKRFERKAIRPVGNVAKKGIAILDKYIPGWTVALDFVQVLPGGVLFTAPLKIAAIAALGKARGMELGQAFAIAATSVYAFPLGPSFVIAKGTQTWISTKGSFLTKLRAAGTDAVASLALVVTVAGTVLSLGSATPAMLAAMAALQVATAAAQQGLNVANAHEAAKTLKKQARVLRNTALTEYAKADAEERQMRAEIARVKASIDEIRRKRAAVSPMSAPAAAITKTAESLGVSETTLILGGLALIGGGIVVWHYVDD